MINNKTIRVLVVAPLRVGGVTSMMLNIQKKFNEDRVCFDYLVFHDCVEPRESEALSLGSKKIVASADDISMQPFKFITRLHRIRKVCKENKVKILHYNADTPMALLNIVAAKLGGVKYVTLHSHNAGFEERSGKGIRLLCIFLKKLLPVFCDNYWTCSELAAQFVFPKSIISARNYSLLPNGIELEKYSYDEAIRREVRQELGVENSLVVGHVGRFSAQKNHSYLLDIFKEVYQRDKSAVLLLLGVGELLDEIKCKAELLGISEATIFYGTSNQMERMYQSMDVFVMPSLHEGLPVTGIEAQACGVPCIFADTITKEVDIVGNSKFCRWKIRQKSGLMKLLDVNIIQD